MQYYFFFYLLLINMAGFFFMMTDKKRSIQKKYRIPEKTLFLIALLGGSLGCFLGMRIFRHKTRHWYFVIGMPAIFLLQGALLFFWQMGNAGFFRWLPSLL